MKEKEIDINNENEILEKFDFNYCYNSAECSRELCMFFNDVCMTKRKNFDKRQALIDLGIIAITLNQQDKRIKELENMNNRLSQGIYWGNGEHFCDVVKRLKKENHQLKQSQNQLAIEELEKIRQLIVSNDEYDEDYGCNIIRTSELYEDINGRIKGLKGE